MDSSFNFKGDTKERTRVNITSIKKNDKLYKKLSNAFTGIMNKDRNDPSSFYYIASYHGFMKDVCWHKDVMFLNWHRDYVLMFENALRTIKGCEDVALPYFKAEDGKLPDWVFEPPFSSFEIPKDVQNDFITKANSSDKLRRVKEALERNKCTSYRKTFGDDIDTTKKKIIASLIDYKLESKIDGYMGNGIWKNIADIGFENPHDSIHVAIGGWMGLVELAAFDPIFWFHHCNVERWYYYWQTINHEKDLNSMKDNALRNKSFKSGIHGKSFEGDIQNSIWYEFVKYEPEPLVPALPIKTPLPNTTPYFNESFEILDKHSFGIKLDRSKIVGSFDVNVVFTFNNTEEREKFGIFQRNDDCKNCNEKPVIFVNGFVPENVEFPCKIKVTLNYLDGEVISEEQAPRTFNIRRLVLNET